jgi:hypothetical protein
MKLPLSFYRFPSLLDILLVLILKFSEMKHWFSQIETTWMKRFLEQFSNETFMKSLKNSPTISRKAEVMSILSNKRPSDRTILERWQHTLRQRFQTAENAYYSITDDLIQKLDNLTDEKEKKHLPDLTIQQFTFIKAWQDGDKTSKEVLDILDTLDFENIALTQLTRRLEHYLKDKQDSVFSDYVLPCKQLIITNAVPYYAKYLDTLHRYFKKLVEADNAQEKITWLERIYLKDDSLKSRIEDFSLNQTSRRLDCHIIPFNNTRYFVGDNILCLDEELSDGAYCIHWIFGTKSHIDILKKEFNIKDKMDISQEAEYIKSIIGAYVNET